ncbi:hypothetical protein JZU46_05720 [bacterium]|jgi:hypothetical protein|nr:hypothetical protein [bacterium]
MIGLDMAGPSIQQLEKHIRKSASDDPNVVFVHHAHQQMKKRLINRPMVMEVLRMGRIHMPPRTRHPLYRPEVPYGEICFGHECGGCCGC